MSAAPRPHAVQCLDEALEYTRGQVDWWANALAEFDRANPEILAGRKKIASELLHVEMNRVSLEESIEALGWKAQPRGAAVDA